MSDPIETINRLFDTLKEASGRTEKATERLIDQQIRLVTHIKTMPIEELRSALKEHSEKSSEEIDDCNGKIELTTSNILGEIKNLSGKVTKMIIVVSVALTVATSGYFLLRYAAEKSKDPYIEWKTHYEQIEKDQQKAFDDKLDKFIKDIKEQMKEFRKDQAEKIDESIHK